MKSLGPASGIVIAKCIEFNAVLTECSLLKNNLDVESAKMLAKIGTEKQIMLSGMKRDQTEAIFYNQNLRPADAILIASDLPFMAVLTTLKCAFRARICELHLQTCTHTFSLLARICQYH